MKVGKFPEDAKELLLPSNFGEEVWMHWDENGVCIVAYNQGGHDHTVVPLDVILAWVARNRPELIADGTNKRVAALEAALKPFLDYWDDDQIAGMHDDSYFMRRSGDKGTFQITAGHVRRARKATGAQMPRMTQYAIYENPSDYPGKFVVRRWFIEDGRHWPDKEPVTVTESLEAAQRHVPAGYYRLERFADDDPCIREVWL